MVKIIPSTCFFFCLLCHAYLIFSHSPRPVYFPHSIFPFLCTQNQSPCFCLATLPHSLALWLSHFSGLLFVPCLYWNNYHPIALSHSQLMTYFLSLLRKKERICRYSQQHIVPPTSVCACLLYLSLYYCGWTVCIFIVGSGLPHPLWTSFHPFSCPRLCWFNRSTFSSVLSISYHNTNEM